MAALPPVPAKGAERAECRTQHNFTNGMQVWDRHGLIAVALLVFLAYLPFPVIAGGGQENRLRNK